MSEFRGLIEELVAKGVDPIDAADIIHRATALGSAVAPKQRTPGALRQERYRERNKPSQVTLSDGCDATSPALDKEIPPTPPKEIKPTPLPPVVVRARDFDTFWALFPNKVGKRDAEAAFVKALHRADLATIIDGLRRYAAKTDDRPWCNPTTFLNQDRWADEPADQPRRQNGHSPPNGKRMNAVEAMLSLQAERENEQTSRTVNYGDDELLPPDKPGLPRLAGDLGQVVEWPVRQRDYQRG